MHAFLEKIRIRNTKKEYYRTQVLAKFHGFEISSLEDILGVGSEVEEVFEKSESDAMEKRALELLEERKKLANVK